MNALQNNDCTSQPPCSVSQLQQRIKNLEAFMWAVATEVQCLPDFFDSLPDKGNAHIMRKIRELKQNNVLTVSGGREKTDGQ